MARKKVTLQYILSDKNRRSTFKTRSRGLMKKADDVGILCKAKPCVIVYPEGESVPQVFPSQDEAMAILNRFRSMGDHDPFNKKMEQQSFLMKRKGKIREQALKSEREHEENEMRLLLHKARLVGHAGLSMEEIANVGCNVDLFLNSIRERITKICGQPPVAQAPTPNVTGGMDTIGSPMMYQDQAPTPYGTGGMVPIGAPTMYQAQASTPYVTNMDTIGAPTLNQTHTPTPYVTSGIETIGAPMVYQAKELLQQEEEWLEWMRSGGGDLGTLFFSGFNGGTTISSTAGLSGNEMIQPYDMGTCYGCPWGDADQGPSSSSAFPHV
ncbi:unnamed protein product [Alopecurus aequalis]